MTFMRSAFLIVASLAFLISSAVIAADFRVLDFGTPCSDVVSLEAARGGMPYEGKLPSGYQFAFRAREMDRDAVAVYSCKDGKFFRGAYIFDVQDGEAAT